MRFGDAIIPVIISAPKKIYKQVTYRSLVCEPFDRGEIPGYFCLINYVLANCFLALRPLFPFQQAQYAQVFPLKPAPFCKLFPGLSSTNMSATSLLLLCESRSVLFSIFPFTAIALADLAGTVLSLLLYY